MAPITVIAHPWPQFRRELETLYAPAAKATRSKLRQVLSILEGLGVATVADIGPELVHRFVASRPPGQSPHTLKSLLSVLRAIASHAEEMGYLAASPFRLRRMKISRLVRVGPPAGKRFYAAAEVRRVLDFLAREIELKEGWARWRARRLYALTATVAYCGTRAREAQRSHVADYDLVNRVFSIKPHDGRLKTAASEAPIAIPPALVPILEAWLEHRLDHPEGMTLPAEVPWMFPGALRKSPWVHAASGHKPVDKLKAVAARAGVPGMTFQALRRSWCTRAEGLGIPQSMITRQARHADESTTRRYYQQRDIDALRAAVDGFTY
jgi:integrase